jgi:hypothetical protein
VIAPFQSSGVLFMPQGTIISGTVTARKSVGLGFVRERATLDILFRDYTLPDGRRFALHARLKHIENGREDVTPEGNIRGVLAANGPQQLIGGIWTRPTLTLFARSPLGLTGISGRIWKGYSLGPIGAASLFVLKIALFRMPEPNIQLPAGAELCLAVLGLPEDAPDFAIPQAAEVPAGLEEFLRFQPFAVTRPNGRLVKDIVNIAFTGTKEELVQAFYISGWHSADLLTTKSWAEECNSFTAKTGYSQAPVSKLMYRDAPPDFIFEKSLNSVLMRHHVRVWKASWKGQEIWLGAATHDIGAGFDPRTVKFTHRIQSQVDFERDKILNDLTFSQCSEPAGFVQRPNAAQLSFDGKSITTDGRLAVIRLQRCEPLQDGNGSDRPKPVGLMIARMVRRVVLETRNYIERENTFFWTYRAIKWTLAARGSQNQSVVDE